LVGCAYADSDFVDQIVFFCVLQCIVPGVDERIDSQTLSLCSVDNVIRMSPRDTFAPLDARDSCSLLISLFATGIHRCPLIDAERKLTGLVTQTDVLRELSKEFCKVWAVLFQ
jgi:hypothetical protein